MLKGLSELIDFEHLGVPLGLEEVKSRRERHRFERLWGHVDSDLEDDEVSGSVEVLPGDRALSSHTDLLQNEALLEDMPMNR